MVMKYPITNQERKKENEANKNINAYIKLFNDCMVID